MTYNPRSKNIEILNRALEHIESVEYQVTARWLFYRLLQDGYYSAKDDYKSKYLPLLSKARKNYYEEWHPNILVDDSRTPHPHQGGSKNAQAWGNELITHGVQVRLDHWYKQGNYVEVWFEAEAMVRQFQHYTSGITLRPFSGMPSIHYKYQAALALTEAWSEYQTDVVVLYFGDYDQAGFQIATSSVRDIRNWCDAPFEFIRCGLNDGDGNKYGIPENPDHPGEYQWEALDDASAETLIVTSVTQHMDPTEVTSNRKEEQRVEANLLEHLKAWKIK